MKRTILLLSAITLISLLPKQTIAHCEVPCGIYHDELRIELIKEHIQTIEKAMNQITAIQSEETVNYNQLVRWINTKETHAVLIQEIVNQYFLTQRVKFADPSEKEKYAVYINQLSSLHELIVFSMKAKQTTDLKYIKDLSNALTKFETAYFGKDAHRHDLKGEHK